MNRSVKNIDGTPQQVSAGAAFFENRGIKTIKLIASDGAPDASDPAFITINPSERHFDYGGATPMWAFCEGEGGRLVVWEE